MSRVRELIGEKPPWSNYVGHLTNLCQLVWLNFLKTSDKSNTSKVLESPQGERVTFLNHQPYMFFLLRHLGQRLRSTHHMSAGNGWKWKWPNGVEKSEMDLFWCISMTNNVKLCNKKSMQDSKLSNSVFLQWDVRRSLLKTRNTMKTETPLTQKFLIQWRHVGWHHVDQAFQKCVNYGGEDE